MTAFIADHREVFGVEPICRVLQIAPSTFYARAAIARNPDLACNRAKQDAHDLVKIKQVHKKSRGRYGHARFGISFAATSKTSPAAQSSA